MRKLFILSCLAFVIGISESNAQAFAFERTWAPVLFTWRFDTLRQATLNANGGRDSNLAVIYAPSNIYIRGMNVIAETSDTAYIRIARFGAETTAVDSVRMLNNTTSNMTPYYNNMSATLSGGSQYRIQYIPNHSGGASHTQPAKVTITIWGILITGS